MTESRFQKSKCQTPTTANGEGTRKDVVIVKQEDDDAAASASLARTITPSADTKDDADSGDAG